MKRGTLAMIVSGVVLLVLGAAVVVVGLAWLVLRASAVAESHEEPVALRPRLVDALGGSS